MIKAFWKNIFLHCRIIICKAAWERVPPACIHLQDFRNSLSIYWPYLLTRNVAEVDHWSIPNVGDVIWSCNFCLCFSLKNKVKWSRLFSIFLAPQKIKHDSGRSFDLLTNPKISWNYTRNLKIDFEKEECM